MTMPAIAHPEAAPCSAVEHGTGSEFILLLHGSAGSSAMWRAVLPFLAPAIPVVTPDLIGYGKSPAWPGASTHSLEHEVAHVAAHLPPGKARLHLVGYSFGGAVAAAMACADPARIVSLTLIEPVIFEALRRTGDMANYRRLADVHQSFVSKRKDGLAAGAMRDFIEFWSGPGSWDGLPRSAQAAMLGLGGKIELDWKACFEAPLRLGQFSELAARTLLIRSSDSPLAMRALVDALHALLPGSARHVVDGANHLLPLTHPEHLARTVAQHMRASSKLPSR